MRRSRNDRYEADSDQNKNDPDNPTGTVVRSTTLRVGDDGEHDHRRQRQHPGGDFNQRLSLPRATCRSPIYTAISCNPVWLRYNSRAVLGCVATRLPVPCRLTYGKTRAISSDLYQRPDRRDCLDGSLSLGLLGSNFWERCSHNPY